MQDKDDQRPCREAMVNAISLLSSTSEQMAYAEALKGRVGNPFAEIVGSIDFVFHPKSPDFLKSFSNEEILDIANIFGRINLCLEIFEMKEVEDLVKNIWWRQGVVRPAAQLLARLNKS